jgi:cytochrome c oxidase assembly protein subunit 11
MLRSTLIRSLQTQSQWRALSSRHLLLTEAPCLTRRLATPGLRRCFANFPAGNKARPGFSESNISAGMYAASIIIAMLGVTYTAVPLYRLFCSSTGFNGTPVIDATRFDAQRLVPQERDDRKRIRVTFESNTSDSLPWTFKPEVREVYVVPGETALTFYKAKSKAKEDVIGIATYNVTPYRAGSYFNKIQCFCFEEQKLKPGEDVDMPVFFFIDPDFLEDPLMKDVSTITLSYTFFNSKYAKGLSPVQPSQA